jgi:hypothetical protein
MPEGYERLRDKLIDQERDAEDATRLAAAIWNKNHPEDPVGQGYDEANMYKKPQSLGQQAKRWIEQHKR